MELEYVIFDLSGKLSIPRYYFREVSIIYSQLKGGTQDSGTCNYLQFPSIEILLKLNQVLVELLLIFV